MKVALSIAGWKWHYSTAIYAYENWLIDGPDTIRPRSTFDYRSPFETTAATSASGHAITNTASQPDGASCGLTSITRGRQSFLTVQLRISRCCGSHVGCRLALVVQAITPIYGRGRGLKTRIQAPTAQGPRLGGALLLRPMKNVCGR